MNQCRMMFLAALLAASGMADAAVLNLTDNPLIVGKSQPPLTMLVMGKDHRLYSEAYNDASDLDGDGELDIRFTPSLEYFGYFDSAKCYRYSSGVFLPDQVADPVVFTCPVGSNTWSGNFLNYITTSRMDALRKVLYGGTRYIDTTTRTVLERTYIPQDAHSWGKEYNSIALDGYDIADYTPLTAPLPGLRHLFANTTLLGDGTQVPRMRVMSDVDWRVWEWVSKERPVAGDDCQRGTTSSTSTCVTSGGWNLIPATAFVPGTLTVSYYDIHPTDPNPVNHGAFDAHIISRATPDRLCGSHQPTETNGSEATHPYLTANTGLNTGLGLPCLTDEYMTLYSGTLRFPTTTTVEFTLDGSDAVEVVVDGNPVVGWYGGHNSINAPNTAYLGSYTFLANTNYTVELRHNESTGGSAHAFYWDLGNSPALTDYIVRVEVCNPAMLEDNCQQYGAASSIFKPVGLLHEYGEADRMKFGLLSGSYRNNTQGGVLRKNIESFTDEVDLLTGIFSAANGIVKTIDAFKIVGFGGGYQYSCANYFTQPLANGNCANWGNPLSEMMYETMRYFAGAAEATSDYDYSSSTHDQALGLPKVSWDDPYAANPYCSKPVQLVISEVNPNYDTDSVPDSGFSSFTGNVPVAGFSASQSSDEVYTMEYGGPRSFYVGESGGVSDLAPTPKLVNNFSSIRGIAPEGPSQQGGYYEAGVAWYGKINDLNGVSGDQRMLTYGLGLNSPIPTIDVAVDGRIITLVPFAKSVNRGLTPTNPNDGWLPTNQIVDFYVEEITPTRGKFRVSFEAAEYGLDYDMDAISEYEFEVIGNEVVVTVNSVYASAGTLQHMGYVVSGSDADGVYLVVRDLDASAGYDSGFDYFLDTPPGAGPNNAGPLVNTGWDDNIALPLTSVRTFQPGVNLAADSLKNPLWYASKYGGFTDEDGDGTPANATLGDIEWDEDADGVPDNYFLVTNALNLGEQLGRAFERILNRTGSSSALSVNAGALSTQTVIYQARFDPVEWTGELRAIPLDAEGRPAEDPAWDAGEVLSSQSLSSRQILTYNPVQRRGIGFRWPADSAAPTTSEFSVQQMFDLVSEYGGADVDDYGSDLVAWVRGHTPLSLGRPFRDREKRLGDIINSDPLFVGRPRRGYPDSWSDGGPETRYRDFADVYQDRLPMVYVGANDGMMHGFQGSITEPGSGEERIAYVPSMVFENFDAISSPLYDSDTHRFLVDGPAKVEDVFFDGEWHTALIGTLGKGGQGIFALDITNPADFDEGNSDSLVLWEFSDSDDADLGYSYGNVSTGRFYNQRWLVAVGNGHNNTFNDGTPSVSGDGAIFLIDAEDGSMVRKFETEVGMVEDPTGQNRNNGIVSPALVDNNGDFIIDVIYAGDLFGNVWKIDVTDTNPTNWEFSFTSGSTPSPLFTAVHSGIGQPITAPIEVGRHPGDDTMVMVYFGTGKFIEATDNVQAGQQTQTLYGLIDTNLDSAQIAGRSDLLEQSFIYEAEVTPLGATDPLSVRLSTDHAIDFANDKGWFIDLIDANNVSDNRGERIIRKVTLRSGRLIATTLQPDDDPCNPGGGSGWLLAFNAFNGSRLDQTPIDLNGDGIYNQEDYVQLPDGSYAPISGVNDGKGTPSSPVIIDRGDDEVFILGTSSGSTTVFDANKAGETTGRQSWRRIR